MRKSVSGAWDMTTKTNGFYNETENRFHVMGFGSSHMYCTVNPVALWEKAGIPSYLLTSQQQPPCVTYYYIKEALKTQSPKVVLLETYMFTLPPPATYDEGVYHDATDFLKQSKNRRDLINELVPKEDRINFHLPFLKYHTRWEELGETDFDPTYLDKRDWLKGYIFLKDAQPISVDSSIANSEVRIPIPEENLEYLNKIVELSKEYNFKLLFIAAPYNVSKEEHGVFNSISDFSAQNGIDFIDFNKLFNELHFDTQTDFYDNGHTNAYGSEKATNYLAEYLKNNYNLKNHSSDEIYSDFNDSVEKYNTEKMSD